MYIDCSSCPGRRTACDGCMMNVLITPATSDDGSVLVAVNGGGGHAIADAEIGSAIDVFMAASMASTEAARSARAGIGPACGPDSRPGLTILRAG